MKLYKETETGRQTTHFSGKLQKVVEVPETTISRMRGDIGEADYAVIKNPHDLDALAEAWGKHFNVGAGVDENLASGKPCFAYRNYNAGSAGGSVSAYADFRS